MDINDKCIIARFRVVYDLEFIFDKDLFRKLESFLDRKIGLLNLNGELIIREIKSKRDEMVAQIDSLLKTLESD